MPTHGCIACPHGEGRCCICEGHQHGLYGPVGLPPPEALGDVIRQVDASPITVTLPDTITVPDADAISYLRVDPSFGMGVIVNRFSSGPPVMSGQIIYTREVDGQHRLFVNANGDEFELTHLRSSRPIPEPVPAPAAPAPAGPTLWDHLIEEDDD